MFFLVLATFAFVSLGLCFTLILEIMTSNVTHKPLESENISSNEDPKQINTQVMMKAVVLESSFAVHSIVIGLDLGLL
jgi:hypothetical protein